MLDLLASNFLWWIESYAPTLDESSFAHMIIDGSLMGWMLFFQMVFFFSLLPSALHQFVDSINRFYRERRLDHNDLKFLGWTVVLLIQLERSCHVMDHFPQRTDRFKVFTVLNLLHGIHDIVFTPIWTTRMVWKSVSPTLSIRDPRFFKSFVILTLMAFVFFRMVILFELKLVEHFGEPFSQEIMQDWKQERLGAYQKTPTIHPHPVRSFSKMLRFVRDKEKESFPFLEKCNLFLEETFSHLVEYSLLYEAVLQQFLPLVRMVMYPLRYGLNTVVNDDYMLFGMFRECFVILDHVFFLIGTSAFDGLESLFRMNHAF